MKRVFLFLAMLLMGVLTFAEETITVSANSEDISQSLDLRVVAKLFAEASTTEQFENMLNNPDSAFSNLDLNGDNQIDYLRVVEDSTANNKLIVIQAVLAKDIYQDVASIYVEKDTKTQEISVQIIGDEYIYGTNYIIEPVYVYRPVIYNWLWSPRWYCWESPWYWGYYPSWWYYRPCYAYHWYYDRCHRFHHHHHYCSFRHGHHPHHNYHAVHNNVSRRDYAISHEDNSFNRRHTNIRNASELRRTTVSQRNGGVRQPNFNSTSLRTFDSKNTAVQRSGNSQRKQTTTVIQRSSGNAQRTQVSQSQRTTSTSVSTQRSTNQSGASRTTQTRSTNNSNRTSVSTQQRSNNGQVRSSSSSTHRSSGSYSSSPSRGSSSSSTTRSSGSYSGSSRSGGSSKSSGNGNSSSRR